MNRFRVLILFFLCSSTLPAQNFDRADILQAAREIMVAARFCTLITLDKGGFPQARIMDPFPPTPSFSVWMATNSKTRKTEQIKNNPKVAINYFDRTGVSSVTLIGIASLVTDREKKAKLWKEEWESFYSNTFEGEDYILIEVKPVQLEVVSYKHKIASEPDSWKPAIVTFPE